MFRKMLHETVIAGAFGLLGLAGPAMATMTTEGDYVPKHVVPIYDTGVVHHGPVDCVTARKIVREGGYQNVKARDCSGEIYRFRAERNGHVVHLRVDRESGNLTRG
jgi:hypothetical protein